jgi:hypothetical protein
MDEEEEIAEFGEVGLDWLSWAAADMISRRGMFESPFVAQMEIGIGWLRGSRGMRWLQNRTRCLSQRLREACRMAGARLELQLGAGVGLLRIPGECCSGIWTGGCSWCLRMKIER